MMAKRIKEAIAAAVIAGIAAVGIYASVCCMIDNDWTFHKGFPESEAFAEEERIDYPDELSAMPCINLVSFEATAETTESAPVSLGMFRLTAYCSCAKCCGKWAENRPTDEAGNEIVYGAAGLPLTAGRSVAIDPSVIPYGTELIINGNVYEAMDCGSGIDGMCIDIYFNDHQEALNFGIQYAEVFIK